MNLKAILNGRRWIVLPLIFLGAAAAPQSDCGGSLAGSLQPVPPDPAEHLAPGAGLTSQAFAALATSDASAGCRSALPAPGQPATLRNDSSDILHGLPTSDVLRPINEPKRSPYYQ